ncbi:MAG TPA: sensor histidine kinase KdpD [Prolixibacteraceae bacterium]|jgi:two-component system sensor histidine kinase KdpD|nr:sensor histidine kinase KdpD [Prolixibacteraceae bacterium]
MTYNDNRPNPDDLLASMKDDEEKNKRGKLKIFFGMCAGVGKTYTMLQAAQIEKLKGADIVIGYVETHNRKETAALVEGFELIPRRNYSYKSTTLEDMDLDAIIARKPQIVLVDELAHTNAPGCRHLKRYQDVQEILDSGIHVYTTVNVQHLESRSEVVAQITGIIVRETVPDDVFESADDIEVIDLTTDELLQRLSEGKVYTPERSKEAVLNFFRKGNITALREMALRIVAERVDKQLHDYMQLKRIRGPWKSGIHLLVAVSYTTQSTRLLRWAKNLSDTMGGNLQAIYVETSHDLTDKERETLDKNISLAKQLGIQFRIVTNSDIVKAIVDFAQKENITHIIIGKPRVRNLQTLFRLGNFVNKLIRYSGNIDVYILGSDTMIDDKFRKKASLPSFTSSVNQYFAVTLMIILTAIIFFLIKEFIGYQVVSFALLFMVSILAFFYGRGPILLAATLSSLIWDYFFIPPPYTLHVERTEDMLMLTMFFIIALLNGVLTSRVRGQEQKIRVREERTHALYQLAKELSTASGINDVLNLAVKDIRKYFKIECAIFLRDEANELEKQVRHETALHFSENDLSIAEWTFRHSSKAGKYTDTLPSSNFTFYPLKGNNDNMGVIAVQPKKVFSQGEDQFWEGFLPQISGKIEREFLREAARNSYILNESDKLYKTLFNSISHELRIPVATIMGASDTLLAQDYPTETRNILYQDINTAAVRLNRLIDNLLNMSRLDSGRMATHIDWCDLHDLYNNVVKTLSVELKLFNVHCVLSDEMPLVQLDFGLMEQVLHNLLLNATQHAPAGSNIRIKFFYDNGSLVIQVMDRGPGFSVSDLSMVFNKFYRGQLAVAGGTGLGLSIVKGIVEAHNGMIVAQNRSNGGALFTIKIPTKISDINDIQHKENL